MANLPAPRDESSNHDRLTDTIVEHLAAGRRPGEIARRIYPDDPRKRTNLRRRIQRMTYSDAVLAQKVGQRAQGEVVVSMIPVTQALIKRAMRGRVDAAKFLFEFTGIHNPKVKHEHSGDVAIKVTFDRPPPVEGTATQITDAEVVED